MKTKLMTIVCVLAVFLAGTSSSFARTDPAMVVADVLVVRPMCFVATIVGSVFFVVSLPIAVTSKSVNRTADVLVKGPAEATFTRPLGDLDDLVDF